MAKHVKLNQKLEAVSSNVTKSRNLCLKLWKEVQAADQTKNKEASKNSKRLSKAEKHFRSCRQKVSPQLVASGLEGKIPGALPSPLVLLHSPWDQAVKAFQSFEQLLVTSVADQKRHWEVELPELIEEFEKLEVGRMTVMKTHLSIFAQLQTHLRAPLDFCIDTAFETSDALNPREDLAEFVREKVQVHQMPPPVEPFKCHLPCSAAAMEAGSDEFFTALNQDCDLASQSRQKVLDAEGGITIELPDNQSSGISISRSLLSPSQSVSHSAATGGSRVSSAADSDAEAISAGAELSQLLQAGSDSEDASDRVRKSSKGAKSRKKKKSKTSSKKPKGRKKKSRAEASAREESERSGGRKSVSEHPAEKSSQRSRSSIPSPGASDDGAEEDDPDEQATFDLKAALKEDKKVGPVWLVVANFDFQPGDSAEQKPEDEDEESDNEDLAFNKGDWLRVTHRQQHDSDEEDTEDEDESEGEDMWWRGFHCRLHGGSGRGIFPSNYVSAATIAQDNPSLHVWLQRPSAAFTFCWAATKQPSSIVSRFVDLWNDIELYRKLECRHLRDVEEEIDRSNLVLQGRKIIDVYLRPLVQPGSASPQKPRWDLSSVRDIVELVDSEGDAAFVPRIFDPCAKEMAQILSTGFETVRKKHPEILGQLSTVYAKTSKS